MFFRKREARQNTQNPAREPGGVGMVGLTRLELVTSRMSSERSNQLSYRPANPSFQRPRLRNRKQWSAPFASARRYLAQGWTWRNPRNGFLTKNLHQFCSNYHMLGKPAAPDRGSGPGYFTGNRVAYLQARRYRRCCRADCSDCLPVADHRRHGRGLAELPAPAQP